MLRLSTVVNVHCRESAEFYWRITPLGLYDCRNLSDIRTAKVDVCLLDGNSAQQYFDLSCKYVSLSGGSLLEVVFFLIMFYQKI